MHISNTNLQGPTFSLVNILMKRVIIFQIKASTEYLLKTLIKRIKTICSAMFILKTAG